MLEVQARDGAGRLARLPLGERTLEAPSIFWLAGKTPADGGDWEPVVDRMPNPAAAMVSSTRFMDVVPAAAPNQLVLTRRLVPKPSMVDGGVRLESVGEHVSLFTGALDLFRDPKRFASALAQARDDAGFARLLYAPGLGEPAHLALLAYSGVDLFDATALHLAAARGQFLTSHGAFAAAQLAEAECACPACRGEAPASFTPQELAAHNQYAARTEIGVVRNAIRAGRLRELVEARVRSHPELTGLMRRLDTQPALFEARAPITRSAPVWATTKESLQRVECRRFRERIVSRYRPPMSAPILLLLPCSHRKPYSKSKTHRAIGDALWNAGAMGLVHEVIVTSPLGIVPRELELTYPAAHYDVPVTGEWDEEEAAMIRALIKDLLSKRSYARVVSHLPKHTLGLVRDLLPADTIVSCEGENAVAPEALRRLELVMRQLGHDHKRANLQDLLQERLRSLADYQFGRAAADALFAGAHTAGKWPTGKVFAAGEQLAMLPTERGLLSLTMAGAKRILAAGVYRVEIDDFRPKGGIFAVGVRDADADIRPGDEVVVHYKGDLRAVGTALMSGREMVQLKRGEAINARHHA